MKKTPSIRHSWLVKGFTSLALLFSLLSVSHAGGPYEGFNPTYDPPGSVRADAVFSGGTAGSVVFLGTGATWTQDNGQLFYDNAQNFLGIGTLAPTSTLHVAGNVLFSSNTVIGTDTSNSVTINADAISIPNDTVITLGGGVSGLTVTGDVILASNTIVDAYTLSFGAVSAGSTSTVTWTEVVDRLGEFVTSSFTATTAGYYEVIAHAGASQTAGSACLILKKNGTSPAGGTVCNQGVTGLASVLDTSLTRVLLLAANDIVRIDAAATTADATFLKATMTIKRIP